MARRTAVPDSIPPTLTSHRAVELIKQQLERLQVVTTLRRDDADIAKWTNTTKSILDAAFGKPNGREHEMTDKFQDHWGISQARMSPAAEDAEHMKRFARRRAG